MKKETAAFTIVKDEKEFLPLWVNYYKNHVDHLYVLNHDTIDDSIKNLPSFVKVIDVHNEYVFSHNWLNKTVKDFQTELLKQYDIVLFAEVDEFLVPKEGSLKDYIKEFRESDDLFRRSLGITLIDNGQFNKYNCILTQKTSGFYEPVFNKTLLSKISLDWDIGFHTIRMDNLVDDNLYLIHLHYFDKDIYINRALSRIKTSSQVDPDDDPNHGYSNKYTNLDDYMVFFNQKQSGKVDDYGNIAKIETFSFSNNNLKYPHPLNKFFDKIYCINLIESPERRRVSQEIFDHFGIEVEWYSTTKFPFLTKLQNTPLSNGEIGCSLSHYSIIKHAKIKNYKKVLILEDDVTFRADLNNVIEDYLNELPDNWERINFDSYVVDYTDSIWVSRSEKNLWYLLNKNWMLNTAYALSYTHYDYYLNYLNNILFKTPCDLSNDINVIHSYPSICINRMEQSNLKNEIYDPTFGGINYLSKEKYYGVIK